MRSPDNPQVDVNPSSVNVQVIAPQSSVAIAPPLLLIQVFSSEVLPDPSHSTIVFDDGVSILGGVVSSMIKLAVVVLLLPHSSVTINITS